VVKDQGWRGRGWNMVVRTSRRSPRKDVIREEDKGEPVGGEKKRRSFRGNRLESN